MTDHVAVETLKTKGRDFLRRRELPAAEQCMTLAAQLFPSDRDIQFDLVRIKALRHDFEGAKRLLVAWPAVDVESRELSGDLAWYQGNALAAAGWYKKAIFSPPKTLASADLWVKYIRSLQGVRTDKPEVKRKVAKAAELATNEALSRYPNDPALLKLREQHKEVAAATLDAATPISPLDAPPAGPEVPEDHLWLAATATLFRESQSQSAQAVDLSATARTKQILYGLGLTEIRRHYVGSDLTDRTGRMSLGYGYRGGGETSLLLAYTPNTNFTYKYYVKIRQENVLAEGWLVGAEFGLVTYTDASFRVFDPYVIHSFGPWQWTAKAYLAAGSRITGAALFDLAYTTHGAPPYSFTPEAYLVGGRDDASRTYLVHSTESPFFTAGAKLTWHVTSDASVVAGVERRVEHDFYQNSLLLGISWLL